MSQVLITPSESLEIAMPFSACRLTDWIEPEVGGVDTGSLATGSTNRALVCQNLIDLF